jgi:hypothetical protein
MIQKPKQCKGTGKAIYSECCGKSTLPFKFGLCYECYKKWLLESDSGNEYMQRQMRFAQKKVKIEHKKETQKIKEKLISTDEYRSKYVQPIINEIARIIDYGQPCIASGLHSGKMNGGHFIAVGSNRTTSLNLHNIHSQSFASNSWKGGDNAKYRTGIKKVYGEAYLKFMESLNAMDAIKLTKEQLIEIKETASVIRSELKKNMVILSPEERIELRNRVNEELGIYPQKYSVWQNQ